MNQGDSSDNPRPILWFNGKKDLRAVVAFCGAGGSTIGIERAGYETVGYDKWEPAVATHNANGMYAYVHDLSNAALDFLIPECDLMWLSPPCQPFSAAGDGEGEFDDRDGFPWALRIIAKRLPPVVIIENVKGLTFAKHSVYFGWVLQTLRGLGYDVDWRVLNSADYGVPQARERCFIVARRDGGPITWPMPTHTEHAGMFTDRWVAMADGLAWYDPTVVINYRQTNRVGEDIYCDATNRPSPTITSQSRSQWIINGETRLTVAEAALLQGFPDSYVWCGIKADQDRQIGNAVPPAVAQALCAVNLPALTSAAGAA